MPSIPTLGRPYQSCTYRPMVELLRYLEANGFTCYIVSGGGRDFMRPITSTIYGIPPERVVGSAQGLRFEGQDGNGDLLIEPALDIFDDGPEKPVRIWSRIGRRPILAAGNSNGDDEMLMYSRQPDAARCGCWCCTTMPTANSTTPQVRNGRSTMPGSTAGPSSA